MFQPDSIHLVDPELLGVLQARGQFAVSAANLQLVREAFVLPYVASPEAMSGVELSVQMVRGLEGDPDVALAVYRPKHKTSSLACILHLHGGGYVAGNTASHEPVHRALALELGCVVISIDYRLAPETRFPGALHDGYAALTWLWAKAETLGIDRRRIGVSGESAGGGLAAALALLARDRGEFSLAFQHLTYPMLDDRTVTRTDHNPYAGEFIWTRESNRFGWASLLGTDPGGPDISPYAAAARAEDLAGLPPTFIATGALDLFVDEDLDYARRLIRAGVPAEFHIYPGAYHGFGFTPLAAVTLRAQRDSMAFLQRALADLP